MKEFSSIRQFRDVVNSVRRHCTQFGKAMPVWTFTGRVKLHGSNGGLVLTKSGELRTQSRSRTIDSTCDNAGFAAWAEARRDLIVAALAPYAAGETVTFFGEWCGGNIQDRVALNECPKHFVVFGAWRHLADGEGEYIPAALIGNLRNHAIGLYNISDIPSYSITIDFAEPHGVQDQLAAITEQVEAQCPWAFNIFNVEGIGEGVVWTCDARPDDSELWFKVKGDLHAKGATKSKVKVVADPEKYENIKTLVEQIVPIWRLEQGFTALREQGVEIDTKATGAYLQWVCRDTLKEEADTILASGFDWKKDVNPPVILKARQFFLHRLNENAGV